MHHHHNGALNATAQQNATLQLVGQLFLDNSVQVRTSTIIIGAFNVGAALLMLLSIFYDSWSAKRRGILQKDNGFPFFASIHPANVYPIVLSTAVIAQSVIFIAVQSGGLQSVFVSGCRHIAEVVWPAMWIVAYTMLVFGLETAIRSLNRNPFQARGKSNVPICVGLVLFLVLITWIPSQLLPADDECLASLVWWTAHYSELAIAIASVLIVFYAISAVVITVQLLKTINMDRDERIAATRIVVYLGFSIGILGLILPYYIQMLLRQNALATSHMAEIVLNLTGLLNMVLHAVLRANAERTAIRPLQTPWGEKRSLRIFGPTDLDIGMQISTPVLLHRSDSDRQLLNGEKSPAQQSPGFLIPTAITTNIPVQCNENRAPPTPQTPAPPYQPPRALTVIRSPPTKSHYSIFPARCSTLRRFSSATTQSSQTTFSEDTLPLPEPLFSRRHRRDDSDLSSATVQIGMRLSHAIQHDGTSPAPSNLPSQTMSRASSFDLPMQAIISPTTASHMSALSTQRNDNDALPPSILHRPRQAFKPNKANKPGWPLRKDSLSRGQARSVMKELPAVPDNSPRLPANAAGDVTRSTHERPPRPLRPPSWI